MVDPISALVAVSLLSPFLVKTGEKFAEKVGEKLADKTGQIYNLLKESFAGDDYAGLTLLRLEQAPENEGRKSALEAVIIRAISFFVIGERRFIFCVFSSRYASVLATNSNPIGTEIEWL